MTTATFSILGEALTYARRKASYGHTNWLVWADGGAFMAERQSLTSVEAACASLATAERFFLVAANVGHVHNVKAVQAGIMLRNARGGF